MTARIRRGRVGGGAALARYFARILRVPSLEASGDDRRFVDGAADGAGWTPSRRRASGGRPPPAIVGRRPTRHRGAVVVHRKRPPPVAIPVGGYGKGGNPWRTPSGTTSSGRISSSMRRRSIAVILRRPIRS